MPYLNKERHIEEPTATNRARRVARRCGVMEIQIPFINILYVASWQSTVHFWVCSLNMLYIQIRVTFKKRQILKSVLPLCLAHRSSLPSRKRDSWDDWVSHDNAPPATQQYGKVSRKRSIDVRSGA